MGGALKTCLGYMGAASGVDEADTMNIQDLGDLIRRKPIDRKRGPIEDKILKLLVYGGQKMRENQVIVGEIRQDLEGFVGRQKAGMESAQKNYIRKRDEIKQVVNDLGFRRDSISPVKETGDFDDSDFYGFCSDFEHNAGLGELGIQEEIWFSDRDLGM